MKMRHARLCLGFGLLFLAVFSARGNTDSRHWVLTSGDTFFAELVKYDPATESAVLRHADDEEKTYALTDFRDIDAAWLLEWAAFSEELDMLAAELKGEFSHYQYKGTHPADFYVYTPSKYRETKNLPMLILFHPGGKGARYVKRFMNAAEELDLIVVSSDAFRNTGAVWNEKDDEMLACFKELLPSLETTVPHDPTRLYMGGSSGGAQRAYHFSAMVKRPWAGIFANGGWIGGPGFYTLDYPAGMRVVMVNGHNDSANRWLERDAAVLEKCGSTVNIFAFEGGHQVPPPMIQFKALDWMLNEELEATPVRK